jgi:hypothetical protein
MAPEAPSEGTSIGEAVAVLPAAMDRIKAGSRTRSA